MMINYHVDGDAKLSATVDRIDAEVRQSIARSTLKLLIKVKREKLNGQVLNKRTGRLGRSITQKLIELSNGVAGIVGTNVEYAPPHEYGFKGDVTVKAHLRMIKMAFGKSISPKQVSIKTHTRKVDLPEKSFLRSALEEMRKEIKQDLEVSIQRGIA
ncbi:HK97 gp10 family phage protein [Acinetobacter pittii]|uniref:HK97 gp10 family phage protein n=1 Tax=Acinetobacter pittii TaxID=48296 RepID=UPI003008129D